MSAQTAPATPSPSPDRPLPPVAEMAVATLALIVVGGIYLAAHIPRHVPLGVPLALLGAAVVLMLWNVFTLSRLPEFAWDKFFLVSKWALLAYGVIAGMLEYVFVLDHVRGSVLVVLTSMLLVYAVDIPLLLGFSVARYQPASPSPLRRNAVGASP